ncbi:GntR family transcriptional regulator|uniref:GntR family transcriptional regulator n=1 Tax=Leuconostoc lactis TaxID=1246 RepID=A0A6L7AE51_LEULA|nr:GntR family transcriptional regulator [Leuconostoc lactis]
MVQLKQLRQQPEVLNLADSQTENAPLRQPWQLPSHNKKAVYLQLINVILQGIEQGALLPGEQLPPERQLAHDLGVNRSTVQHALNELVSQGILLPNVHNHAAFLHLCHPALNQCGAFFHDSYSSNVCDLNFILF